MSPVPRPDGDRERCRMLREDGLTIREIAEATGIPRSTVGDYVKGLHPDNYTARVIDRQLAFIDAYVNRPDLTVTQCAQLAGYACKQGTTRYRTLHSLGVPLRWPEMSAAQRRARERRNGAARVASP